MFLFFFCAFFLSAPCVKNRDIHDKYTSHPLFVRDVFLPVENCIGLMPVPAQSSKAVSDIRHLTHVFNQDFIKHARSSGLSYGVVTDIVRILKKDGVDDSGRYKVCILVSRQNSIASFRWKKSNGMERVYYAYSSKGGGIRFYDKKGLAISGHRPFTMPLMNPRISSPFGMRRHPIKKVYKQHNGVDFSAPKGTAVYAAGPGKVIHLGTLPGYGKCVRIQHDGGYVTTYAHLDRYTENLRKGSPVMSGEQIGCVGMTGHATAPHLHYEVRRGKRLLNPVLYTEKASFLSTKEKKNLKKKMDWAQKCYAL